MMLRVPKPVAETLNSVRTKFPLRRRARPLGRARMSSSRASSRKAGDPGEVAPGRHGVGLARGDLPVGLQDPARLVGGARIRPPRSPNPAPGSSSRCRGVPLFPCGLAGGLLGLGGFELLLRPSDCLFEPGQLGGLRGVGQGHAGLAAADGGLLDVGEEGGEAVELAGGERVELVVVALAAAHRGAEPDRPRRSGRGRRRTSPRTPWPGRPPPRSSGGAGCSPRPPSARRSRRAGGRRPVARR